MAARDRGPGVRWLTLGLLLALGPAATTAQEGGPSPFTPEQIRLGSAIYARHCSPCHGSRMQDPQGAFNLRAFPHDQPTRFSDSVSRGKNSMPPWGGVLLPEEIDALWAYVVAGEP